MTMETSICSKRLPPPLRKWFFESVVQAVLPGGISVPWHGGGQWKGWVSLTPGEAPSMFVVLYIHELVRIS